MAVIGQHWLGRAGCRHGVPPPGQQSMLAVICTQDKCYLVSFIKVLSKAISIIKNRISVGVYCYFLFLFHLLLLKDLEVVLSLRSTRSLPIISLFAEKSLAIADNDVTRRRLISSGASEHCRCL